MRDRLTDADLDAAIEFARKGYTERTLLAMRPSLGASMSDVLLFALEEIRELRAMRLSTADRSTLAFVREAVTDQHDGAVTDPYKRCCTEALAVLDRLLGGDSAFIAADSPSTVLALLNEIARLDKAMRDAWAAQRDALTKLHNAKARLEDVTDARNTACDGWEREIDQSDYPDGSFAKERRGEIASLRKVGR